MQFVELSTVAQPLPLSELSKVQVQELQYALSLLGYPVGDIDGLVGPKTRSALAEFKADVIEGNPDLVGPKTIEQLKELTGGMDASRADDFSTREGTISAIRRQCDAQGLGRMEQIAYVLATVEWETAKTFRPVREAFWKNEEWRRDNFRYYPYYGRGYVQLTWKNNYEKYGQLLNLDLVAKPDLAMDPPTAAFILVHGFKTGTFTGRKLTDYVNDVRTDFVNARRCINGIDRAHEISGLADRFLKSLS
ncbi:MAG: carboxypeptidase [Gammaproteobacteria bacterium RIFCSPLOWO2_02_FULL_61_13]|nr:MAG: carboxypeptidase [Gammaproteobacteria bacterium RIFCSPLOWO2_02_FULL_61_13]